MTTLEILRDARDRIANPQNWTGGGHYAEDRDGHPVNESDRLACRWCAMGSLYRSARNGTYNSGPALVLRAACEQVAGSPNVAVINDTLGHETIIRVYDRAIELAGAAS